MTQQIFPVMQPPFGELPSELETYHTLDFCSNVLQGVQIPIERADGPPPLLIGKGPGHPRVWMTASGFDDGKPVYFQIVKENVAIHPAVQVDVSESVTTIKFQNGIVMCRVEAAGQDKALVTTLDLRPTGLNIIGDRRGLKLGTNSMSGNTVVGARTFVAIG